MDVRGLGGWSAAQTDLANGFVGSLRNEANMAGSNLVVTRIGPVFAVCTADALVTLGVLQRSLGVGSRGKRDLAVPAPTASEKR